MSTYTATVISGAGLLNYVISVVTMTSIMSEHLFENDVIPKIFLWLGIAFPLV